jgi:hypothetical protein
VRKLLWCAGMAVLALVPAPSGAENDDNLPVYVTRQDCARLVAHHPDANVTFQPGKDVHGRYVAPADLPNDNDFKLLPDRITFDLKVNPLAFGAQQSTNAEGKFSNTAINAAHIDVDLASGTVRINGRTLDGEQTRIVTEACSKAGYR